MFKVGDKIKCKTSTFLSSDFWLLKDRFYTIKELTEQGVKFEEFRDNVKLRSIKLEKYFYTTVELRKIKLQEIEKKLNENLSVSIQLKIAPNFNIYDMLTQFKIYESRIGTTKRCRNIRNASKMNRISITDKYNL